METYFLQYASEQTANLLGSMWMVTAAGILSAVIGLSALFFILSKRKTKAKKSSEPKKQKTALDYEHLLTAIKKQNGRLHTLLLAAGSLHDLPVTVPVNLAVGLAKTHKCLLIDLDIKRNAVARVFDLEITNGNFKTGSYPTPIRNLSVWPARNFELLRHMNLRLLIEDAAKKHDYILIYAPYLTTLPDRRQIAASARQAVVFTGQNGSQLMQLLNQCNCKVMQEC